MKSKILITAMLVVVLALSGAGWLTAARAHAQDAQAGWLGVSVLETDEGVQIASVLKGSPAEAAGLRQGMIIRAVDDTAIRNATHLRAVLSRYAPGTTVTLTVLDAGEERRIEATLGARPAVESPSSPLKRERGWGMQAHLALPGARFTLTDAGLRVDDLDEASALAQAGLQAGDVITAIDGEPVQALLGDQLLRAFTRGQAVELTVQRGAETLTITVDARDLWGLGLGMLMPFNAPAPARPTQLGVSFRTLTPAIAAEEGLSVDQGALIVEVYADTPATKAGLQAGDIVLEVAGDVLDEERTLADRLLAYEEGDVVTLRVLRGEQELALEVTLGPRNAAMGLEMVPGPQHLPPFHMMPGPQDGYGFRFDFGGNWRDLLPEDFLKQYPFLGDLLERLPDRGSFFFGMPGPALPEVTPSVPGTNA